jgi:MYXO-CTERM domain-containing protein
MLRPQMRRRATIAAAALVAWASGGGDARAETLTLESSALRLEVTTEPYAYRVVEKAGGEVLLAQSGSTFVVVSAAPAGATDAGGADAARADARAPDTGAAPVDARPADGGPPDAAIVPDASEADRPPPPVEQALRAVRAVGVRASATALEADLVLEGSAESAHVKFSFPTPQVLEIELGRDRDTTRRVREEFEDRQEHVYGIWEYPWDGNLDNRGVDREYLGVGQNTGSLYTSGRAPFYLTSRRYGLYARSSARGRFTVAVNGKTSFAFDERRLVYDVIYGPRPYDVLARYAALAGGPFMPPLWSLGSTWWSDDFHRGRGPTAQDNVVDVATQLQALRIPAAGLLIDRPFGTGFNGWGNIDFDASFPDPARMVSDLRARGLELILWVANRAWNGLYTEGGAQGFLFPGDQTLGPAVDLRNPAAYAWLKGKLAPFVELGAKGYKIDRGEQGEHPDAIQNDNVTLFARLTREGLAAKHGADAFVFARNVADTGRQHAAIWNGDTSANFTGLAYSIVAGLRSGVLVMPMWGSDTGGYLRGAGGPSEEVFARWLGFSAMSPMMEVLIGDQHTPWSDYSPALVDIARKHASAHHDLIPYTRSFLQAATRTGVPVMRALVLEAPEDPALANRADEYLYGSELLVAPVITAAATGRAVYLPAGRWLDYNARRGVSAGAATVTASAPLDSIPVFVREGGIVPRGDILRGNNNWTPGWAPGLRIEVFPAEGAMSRSFDYFTGAAVEPITAATAAGTVTVAFRDLGLPGALEIAVRELARVSRNGAALAEGKDYTFDRPRRTLRVPFTGTTTVVVEGAVSVFAPGGDDPPPADAGADAASAGRDARPAAGGGADGATTTPPPDRAPATGGCACSAGGPRATGGSALLLLGLALLGRRRRGR